MAEFVKVCALSGIPDPGKQLFEIDDRLIVVFHVGGTVSCLEDLCTHDGGTLADGDMADDTIACPRHGAKFDIRTGAALTMPATEDTIVHEVKVDGDEVWVKLTS
ncbi:MAG: non-heme iron oxygenase ferredoxin subunit [Planctomycetota bacterium]